MLLVGGGREGRSELRRPADALALGQHAHQHAVAGQPDRHAVSPRRRLRRSRTDVRARSRTFPIAQDRFHADEITYISIGEGATSEGEFWESLNTACTRSAPVLYLVEDNGYAISVPVEVQTPGGDISRLVESFPNLKVLRCDGTDFLASYRTLGEAVSWIRRERQPAFVHAKVIAAVLAFAVGRRAALQDGGGAAEPRRSAIRSTRMRAFLQSECGVSDAELDAIAADVDREIAEATDAALAAPKPTPDTADWYVFSPDVDPTSSAFETPAQPEGKPDTMVAAINRTLKDEMAANPRIVMFGEDVADASRAQSLPQVPGKGGVFKVTHGLQRLYGSDRVFNSPLAEANIVGRAVGMATRGLKPVVEIQFFDYIWPAMMQLQATRCRCCAIARRTTGRARWSCACRSAATCAAARRTTASRASASSRTAPACASCSRRTRSTRRACCAPSIRCADPVLFLEHKHLYRQTYNKGAYPGSEFMIPFGKGSLRREGTDVVVLTWGALVQRSLLAAQQAEKDGISAAVFDLRTIVPVRLGRHRQAGARRRAA